MRGSEFKQAVSEMKPGDKIRVSNPGGGMVMHSDPNRAAVFLAGGLGFAPMRSMIEWSLEQGLSQQLYLFYAEKELGKSPMLPEMKTWAEQNANFFLIHTLTGAAAKDWDGETGRITDSMLARHLPKNLNAIYYVAGPGRFVSGMREILTLTGVFEESIRSEEFAGY